MSRLIGRIFLVALFSAGVAWAVWAFALKRPDLQMQLYARSAELRHQAAKPRLADANTFRATACAAGPCVLVEAGGYSFLVGAGDGAAEGLSAQGLLRSDIKAVLLTDLSRRSLEGLPSVRDATWLAGRREPLPVHGPAGIENVVAGVNAMLQASDAGEAARLTSASLAPEAAPLAVGAETDGVVFRAGNVTVRSMPLAQAAASGRIYRFDFEGKVLVVAGCGAVAEDFASASRGANSAYAVAPAASVAMVTIERDAAVAAGRDREAGLIASSAQGCLSADEASAAMAAARMSGAMLAPLYPAPRDAPAARAWQTALSASGVTLTPGAPGAALSIDSAQRPGSGPVVTPVAAQPPPPALSPAAAASVAVAAPPAVTRPAPAPSVAPRPVVTPTIRPAPPSPTPVVRTTPAPAARATPVTPTSPAAAPPTPRPRTTPRPVATASASPAAPSPSPTPVEAPTVAPPAPEPSPEPIFPRRPSAIPSTGSPLLIRPDSSPSPITPTPPR
jgi:hypothetical protein